MNRYFPIDFAKILMAIMIVALHSMPLFHNAGVDQYVGWGFDLVVPLFFCFSGFFYGANTDLKKSLRHLIPLYLFYAVLSWPLSFIVFEGLTLWQALHKALFFGTFNIGWFIVSLAWCMIIIFYLDKLRNRALRYGLMTASALLCYVVCMSMISYSSVITGSVIGKMQRISADLISVPQWSFMRGLLFFTIGFFFNRFAIRIPRYAAFAMLLMALTAYFAELTLTNLAGITVTSINCSIPFVIFSGMATILSYCRPTDDHGLGKEFRRASTMLYLSHPMIMFLLYRATGINGGLPRLVITLAVFAILFATYQRLRKLQKPYLHWLKYAC